MPSETSKPFASGTTAGFLLVWAIEAFFPEALAARSFPLGLWLGFSVACTSLAISLWLARRQTL